MVPARELDCPGGFLCFLAMCFVCVLKILKHACMGGAAGPFYSERWQASYGVTVSAVAFVHERCDAAK